MKDFLKQITIFGSVVFTLVIAMDQITFSDDFICHKTSGTEYEKVIWNLHMLNNESEKLQGSTIFLGSSLVQGGINDSIGHLKDLKVYNFAVPHNGYDLNLYFAERLKSHNPHAFVFLQEKNSYGGLHKLTPLVNRPSDLLRWGQSINFHFVNYLFKRAKLSTEYVVYAIGKQRFDGLRKPREFGIVFDNKEFVKGQEFTDSFLDGLQRRDEYLNLFQNDFLYAYERQWKESLQFLRKIKRKTVNSLWVNNNWVKNNKSQQAFLRTSKEWTESEGILFAKVYVPVLSDVVDAKNYTRTYFEQQPGSAAEVLTLENFSFLKRPGFWSDNAHVNETGARLFSERIFDKYVESRFLAKK